MMVMDWSSSGPRSRRHMIVESFNAVRSQIVALVSFLRSVPSGNGISMWSPGNALTTADRRINPNRGVCGVCVVLGSTCFR